MIPSYIEKRIRRPASGSHIVTGSTPVVSFGNAQKATIATLGLNPSRLEFQCDNRRLATHESLGTSDLANAPIETIGQVLEDCNRYFERNPYRWFDSFMPILKACGKSFYNGTACHLDLVQWATNPVWSKLPNEAKKQLLADDAAFLAEQLQNENLQLLLVNGRRVFRELRQSLMRDVVELPPISGLGHVDTRLFAGKIGRVQVFAWSTNLQSSFGVTNELRTELGKRVAEERN